MKLSKIYSNKPDVFPSISFNSGFNVIFAEVKFPKDESKDSHNLGKTTLITLIDFLLLSKGRDIFLFRHQDLFSEFVFFLELRLNSVGFITIRRSVESATKIAIKLHPEQDQDFTNLADEKWDHHDVAFERAKEIVDNHLALSFVKPWNYRMGVGYFLRRQNDYQDVFQISKFSQGRHIQWKPYMAKVLGFDAEVVQSKYELQDQIVEKENLKERLEKEVSSTIDDFDKLRGQIEVKREELRKQEDTLRQFKFAIQEGKINEALVRDIETKIGEFNGELYRIRHHVGKISAALEKRVNFDLDELKSIFEESKIYFSDSLERDYEQLLEFNKKLFKDREARLKQTLRELRSQEQGMLVEVGKLDEQRAQSLLVLKEEETFEKYKRLHEALGTERAILAGLELQLKSLERIRTLGKEIRALKSELQVLEEKIRTFVERENSTYSDIRRKFASLVSDILGVSAMIHININEQGNLDFKAEIFKDSEGLEATSEHEGTSYQKLLCMAFDIAVLEHYASRDFYRFVYHDGGLEGLDDRKKKLLLKKIREICVETGIQYILTAIDSDLPLDLQGNKIEFDSSAVVRRLDDSGRSGRLFRMEKF